MKKSIKNKFWSLTLTALMICFVILYLIPFIMLFINSFKHEEAIFDVTTGPDFTYFENFKLVFGKDGFLLSLFLTIIICGVTILGAVICSSMSGYIVSRAKRGFIKNVYWLFVITMIVPYQTGVVILYRLGVTLRMINTVPYLIFVYLGGNVAYSSLIYFAFTKSIPYEMEESAIMDGCGKFKTFINIIFPLLLPATGTVIATEVFWYWNDMQGPLIYLGAGIGRAPKTLMMFIYTFKIPITGSFSVTQWAPTSALCLLGCIPMVIFFLCTQKYLLRGLIVGAVKG
jgi:raffinose/stachyose/melibiose transport system permease protein